MSEYFLLDTNIPSETLRPVPNVQVAAWLKAQERDTQFLSAITIGELRRGCVLLPASKRREALERWLEDDLSLRFRDRILPVTQRIANRWGVLDATAQLHGEPLNTADGLIAATALEHGLTLVTRNVRDFRALGVPIVDPWEPSNFGSKR